MVFILPSPEIVDMTELTIVGLGGEYCLETRDEIPRLWWQLQSERHPIQQGVRATTYGVFQNVSADAPFAYYGRFFYLAGVAAGKDEVVRRPYYSAVLKGGRYAVFRFTGSYSEMTRAFDTVMLRWLPESEWKLDSREVFERYPSYRIGDKDLPMFEVWLPVSEKA
ncbi:GyrI-like domain-containing protein [Thalassovita aquimarina]|uniref:GyrI-like domain-containing protein n=1 Tax=Thalassovita aquimarina TaxID=2785917 RepID=A0ABS5HX72_9RHOB|nr:GyrI-like domain-containing protein [Thalassovita aquimarina]MBR9653163.1 GyrI-like domain-containing protein [Thalassovita aquimarina]